MIISLFIFLQSCISTKHENLAYRQLSFTGSLSEKNVDDIILKLQRPPKLKQLIINSGGGDELAALKLAKEISKQNIDVVVDGACISACAHILLPAARKVFIVEDSVIGFHGNIFGWLELFARTNQDEYNDLLEDSAAIAKFLNSTGVDIDVLFCAANLHEPKAKIIYDELNVPTRKTRYRFLVADQKKLDWYGVNVTYLTGYSPAYIENRLKKSGVNLNGTRTDWVIADCKAVDMTTWKKVKKALRDYSNDKSD